MVDLYGELQPILDPVAEQRKEAAEREDAAEVDDVKHDRIAVAVVGVPNAVSHPTWTCFTIQVSEFWNLLPSHVDCSAPILPSNTLIRLELCGRGIWWGGGGSGQW